MYLHSCFTDGEDAAAFADHCAVGEMGLVPQRSCLLFTSMLPHCCAMACEVLLQTSPCFLKQRQEGCFNSLKRRARSCNNTALHNPDSAFCQSFLRKWMLLYLDLTLMGAQLLGLNSFDCLSLEHNPAWTPCMAPPPLAPSFHSAC